MFIKICFCISLAVMNGIFANDTIDDITADLLRAFYDNSKAQQTNSQEKKENSQHGAQSKSHIQKKSPNQKIIESSAQDKNIITPKITTQKLEASKKALELTLANRIKILTYRELAENFEEFADHPEKLKNFIVDHAALIQESEFQIKEWAQAGDTRKLKLKFIGSYFCAAGSSIVSILAWFDGGKVFGEHDVVRFITSVFGVGFAALCLSNAQSCKDEMNNKELLLLYKLKHEQVRDWLKSQQQ
jgi:hypothetical protein